MIYILFGDDEFSSREALDQIKAGLGDDEMLSTNTTVFDGDSLKLNDLIAACSTIPFMTSTRLVIVRRLLGRLQQGGKAKGKSKKADSDNWESLAEFLPQMPPSTVLVLYEGQIRKDGAIFKKIKNAAELKEYPLIRGAPLVSWIADRAEARGSSISSSAANLLADYIGSNLWVLDNELEKLSLYKQGEQIDNDDITKHVSYIRESNIFAVIDSLISRQVAQAANQMHRLLFDGAAPAYLLFMITRQYRLMVQAKEMSTSKVPSAEIGSKLGIRSDWALRKLLDQSRKYTIARLEADYHRLLDTDISIKTGRYNPELALDLLLVELCRAS